jgi:hypothetical protein
MYGIYWKGGFLGFIFLGWKDGIVGRWWIYIIVWGDNGDMLMLIYRERIFLPVRIYLKSISNSLIINYLSHFLPHYN